MSSTEFREKWIKSNVKVDDKFLQIIDTLYKTYTQEEDYLSIEIQEILIRSQKNIQEGNYFLHKDVMEKVR